MHLKVKSTAYHSRITMPTKAFLLVALGKDYFNKALNFAFISLIFTFG